MTYTEQKKKYPILAVRVKPMELEYIREKARQSNMKLPEYVRATLLALFSQTVK